jgi:hypothetical protein
MSILITYVLFFMLYVMHFCLVTLRSAPFAWIESHFLATLLLHMELKFITPRWKLYKDGLYQRPSHRCEVFQALQSSITAL